MSSKSCADGLPKVKIFLALNDTTLKSSIHEILENLIGNVSSILGKHELSCAEVTEKSPDKSEAPSILVTDDMEAVENFGSKVDAVVLFLEDSLTDEVVKILPKYEISGIFFKKNFRVEYEEKGKFESTMKETIRKLLMERFSDESKFFKYVDWKYKRADNKSEEHIVSLFLDPSMKETVSHVRYVCSEILAKYKEYKLEEALGKRRKLFEKGFSWKDARECFSKTLLPPNQMVPAVLVEGETGTGKTLVARLIANTLYESLKNVKIEQEEFFCRFSAINVPPDIIDSELFGVVRGAYTDSQDRAGRFLRYAGGVVFLDEIGDLDPKLQTKLLLYLDDWTYRPVGSDEVLHVPTVLIAATNRNLKEMVATGTFRADLYHRFMFKIKLPPLRERKKDIRLLISFCLSVWKAKEKGVSKISHKAIEKLENYDYPGNFREMLEIVKKAIYNAHRKGRDIILERDVEI